MKQMLINYIVQREKVDENAALVKQVFVQLREAQLKGVKYAAYKMSENVFVHIAQFENEEVHQQFTLLAAFKIFSRNIAEWQLEQPVTNPIEEIGSFSTIYD